jgi:hypothetical protein
MLNFVYFDLHRRAISFCPDYIHINDFGRRHFADSFDLHLVFHMHFMSKYICFDLITQMHINTVTRIRIINSLDWV